MVKFDNNQNMKEDLIQDENEKNMFGNDQKI